MTDKVRLARTLLSLLDLTSLNDGDSDATIRALAASAATPFGPPAALCVYPRLVATARAALAEVGLDGLKVATVVNFPEGRNDTELTLAEIRAAIAAGAAEIDMVFPWRRLLAGDRLSGERMVAACRDAVPAGILLKVIIESGELAKADLIRAASDIAIAAGADFIKTSTGKTAVSATLPAVRVILESIRASGKEVGCKASGGIRTLADAAPYLSLATEMMGADWISPRHFRFGASSLLADILVALQGSPSVAGVADGY
jgi:deoxyribose-phosphate aldolase